MRLIPIIPLLALAVAAPREADAQRYAAPAGARSGTDTTIAFPTGDQIRVTSYPRMASGIEICGTVAGGMQWGKLMFAHSNAERGAQDAVVSFPSAAVTANCQTYHPTGGDQLLVRFTRTVRDEVGRIGRVSVGQIVLPLAPLVGRRVTFQWQREGAFEIRSVTPAPDTLGPPRP